MNEQTAKLIQELADKFGTTTEYLWAVLVRQAPISSTADLIVLVISFFTLLASAYFIYWSVKGGQEASYDKENYYLVAVIISVIACIISAIILISGVLYLDTIAAGFCNPEYWALKQIIK
jgi:uncharacterized membrane protein